MEVDEEPVKQWSRNATTGESHYGWPNWKVHMNDEAIREFARQLYTAPCYRETDTLGACFPWTRFFIDLPQDFVRVQNMLGERFDEAREALYNEGELVPGTPHEGFYLVRTNNINEWNLQVDFLDELETRYSYFIFVDHEQVERRHEYTKTMANPVTAKRKLLVNKPRTSSERAQRQGDYDMEE